MSDLTTASAISKITVNVGMTTKVAYRRCSLQDDPKQERQSVVQWG